jgi:oligopeptide/dipeptide ABC transporter ATP-binding protein
MAITESTNARLLEVDGLQTYFFTDDGVLPAVDGVSFHLDRGETLCVVGESGCGKSVTAHSIMQLVPTPPGRYVSGRIDFEGRNLLGLSKESMRQVRGREIAMVFQEPMSSLNPVHTVGRQIAEAIKLHRTESKKEALAMAEEALRLVKVPDPHRRVHEYPHQLSGGMRQRAMIAMALSCRPKLLIADEPTTALDVTVQAQILELIRALKAEVGMAVMLITHDLGVVAEMAQRVVVMYAGKVVEQGTVGEVFAEPKHPYTRGLLSCIPRLDQERGELQIISGQVPSPLRFPPGCRFHPRCPEAMDICKEESPPASASNGRYVSCWLYDAGQGGAK